jgi:hypothetical protein
MTQDRRPGSSGKYFMVTIVVALAVASPTASAQDPPGPPDGNRIEGTWDMQVQWRNCDDGTPILQPTPDLRSFARGGVLNEIDSSIWCDSENGHCQSLGVWKHLGGRRYVATYKRSRLDPSPSFDTDGFLLVVSNITHEPDDTLTARDFLRFFDRAGDLVATRCRTAVGTRLRIDVDDPLVTSFFEEAR